MERCYPDAIVNDDGIGWRRAGVAMMCAGGVVALLGFTTVTLAYYTWSGYALEAAAAIAGGLAAVGAGWSILRHGDRLGPRLVAFGPSSTVLRRSADPWADVSWTYGRDRVHVPTVASGELPTRGLRQLTAPR
jgi:hypothetical protein